MPVLTRAKFKYGFEHTCSWDRNPTHPYCFTSAWGEKDRAFFPFLPADNFEAVTSSGCRRIREVDPRHLVGPWLSLCGLQSALARTGCTAQSHCLKGDNKSPIEMICFNCHGVVYALFQRVSTTKYFCQQQQQCRADSQRKLNPKQARKSHLVSALKAFMACK